MSFKLHHWQTKSESLEWCKSGLSVLNIGNPQASANTIYSRLKENYNLKDAGDVQVFILPILTT